MIRGRIRNAHPPIRYHAMQGKSMAAPTRSLLEGQANRLAAMIRGEMPRASGELVASVQADIAARGEGTDAIVSVEAPHAVPVLRGARPHRVSGRRLLSWVMNRLGRLRPGQTPRQAAYAVARHIELTGTPARDYLSRPVREFRRTLGPDVRRHITSQLRSWMSGR